MKCSDFIAMYLESIGVRCIFGYQGGSITHLIDSFSQKTSIKYIQNYNEQASAIGANAYARLTNNEFGVAIASNGPGATNLITGIADAYCDSVPVLYLTGQVHTWAMKGNKKVRQESFQEIDIISLVKNITKYCVTVKDVKKIKYELQKACYIAMEGRKGPVLVDIPVDIQGMDINVQDLLEFEQPQQYNFTNVNIEEVKERILKAKKPIILVGGGIRQSNSQLHLDKLLDVLHIPIVASMQGLDAVDNSRSEYIGMVGIYGNRCANIALQNSDLLLILGSRLDMRQTGKNFTDFASNAFKIHIDIDINEINNRVVVDKSIICDLGTFIRGLTSIMKATEIPVWSEWKKIICDLKNEEYNVFSDVLKEKFTPYNLLFKFNSLLNKKPTAITLDVGQNQIWVTQILRVACGYSRIINSGGLGAMGFSLPAGIAAYYTGKFETIISFMGDGGLQMNLQELCLVGDQQIPIKILVLNNFSLGLIREMHERYYENNCIGSVEGFSQPNLYLLAKAYNINYFEIKNVSDIDYLAEILDDNNPYIINCILEQATDIYVELQGYDNLENQKPYLSEDKLNSIHERILRLQ